MKSSFNILFTYEDEGIDRFPNRISVPLKAVSSVKT